MRSLTINNVKVKFEIVDNEVFTNSLKLYIF